MSKKIVIIGSSIAAHTVAVSLRDKNKDCAVTMISDEPFPVYDRRKLPEYLAGRIKERDLFLVGPDFYEQQKINFLKERKVVTVSTARRQVYFKNKDVRENTDFDFLAVCSGAKTVLPEITGINKDGIYKLDNLNDYKTLRTHMITDPVCLIGDLENGLVIAKSISSIGKEAKIITSDEPVITENLERIEIIKSEVVELIGESGIQAVKLQEGKIIGTDLPVFLPSVIKANIDFLKDTNIKIIDDMLLVDDKMNTSISNIFASGSVCKKHDAGVSLKAWDEVVSESKILAENLLQVIGG